MVCYVLVFGYMVVFFKVVGLYLCMWDLFV